VTSSQSEITVMSNNGRVGCIAKFRANCPIFYLCKVGESWLPDMHWCPHGPTDYGTGEGDVKVTLANIEHLTCQNKNTFSSSMDGVSARSLCM
jgi:hypothetical protein